VELELSPFGELAAGVEEAISAEVEDIQRFEG